MRKLYCCVGCRQIHYDDDYREEDGDLIINNSDKFLKSVERVKEEMFE